MTKTETTTTTTSKHSEKHSTKHLLTWAMVMGGMLVIFAIASFLV